MKVVALVSGGKDSCFAMMKCIDYGHEIIALANLMPVDDSVDELDSYMYQTVGHQIVIGYTECMGLPLFRRRIHGSTRNQQLSYRITPGDEVEDLFILLNAVKQQIPSVAAVSSGAIASDYQRLRVESICARLGLVSLAYLWKEDQAFLFQEMIRRGIVAVIIKVASMGLNQKHLGRELVDLQSYLLQINELYGINVCGEGGEYETLTLDCPLFKNARIVLDKFQVVLHSPDSIAPVGVLHPLAFHLERKIGSPSCRYMENNDFTPEKSGCIFHVKEEFSPNYLEKCKSRDVVFDKFSTIDHIKMCISTCKRETFSIGCWVPNSSPCEELQKDLMAVLHAIELQLRKDGLDWAHALYIHLYISDMKQFGLANDVYVSFITENKCYLGVPSRSTIEVPIAELGLGNAYVEVLVSTDQCKRVLHVQSISCWAPSCIGPYSQATLHKEVLYMAGQLGLDPPTMLLQPGGPAAEMDQALLNCEAVANCFKSSIATSALIIIVYCSASISSSEMAEIQNLMESFLKHNTINNNEGLGAYPIILYVLVPNLPKGALVEVKPVLHLSENGEYGVQSVVLKAPAPHIPNYCGFNFSEWHNSCCQINVVPAKICMALISATKDHAGRIYSEAHRDLAGLRCDNSHKHMEAIALFFTNLIDKIISDNGFSWQDLKNLRFYFSNDLVTAADLLFPVFSEAFSEFAESSKQIEASNGPIFNLVPVLGSGRSASMDNLITCELFASKL